LERFGRIDILFHNAGINPAVGHILKTTERQLDKLFEVNIKAAFGMVRDVAPQMIKQGLVILTVVLGKCLFLKTFLRWPDFKVLSNYC
jgi:NADP-dependent 3-hydroxy acid dehydrogenase YdfG